MEEEDRGYHLPDENKFLCVDHFDDVYLKDFVRRRSREGLCSYCGRKTNVISLSEFIKYIMERIMQHYTSPDDDGLYLSSSFYDDEDEEIPGLKRVGSFITRENAETFNSTKDLLVDIGLVSDNETLNQDIEECFIKDEWIQKDSMIRSMEEELSDLWKEFVKMVIHQRRYTFYMLPQFDDSYHSEENGLQNILSELSRAMDCLDMYKILPVNTTLYRCRYISSEEEVCSFDNLTSPPDDKSAENRMNPTGVSMFYGMFDPDMVKEEARDSEKGSCVIGKFATTSELTVLNLSKLPPLSFWNEHWQELSFIYSFTKEVSKPISAEHNSVEYVPTQIFAEYIRYCCKDKNGKGIDGILFKSSKTKGDNIVLFYNQEKSHTILKLEKIIK
ncbi:MAG: RES domain-containing protein [Paludibacteraceae bacterium]|nr:RES domain-containing protein [Paludibacteraceae bacterium]